MCQFTAAVSPEIKEQYDIALLYRGDRLVIFSDDDGFEEFISNAIFIAGLDSSHGVFGLCAFSLYHGIIGQGNTLPAVIAVHCIVAAGHGGESCAVIFGVSLNIFNKPSTRFGVYIPPIAKTMYKDIVNAGFFSSPDKSFSMVDVGMYTTI